MQNSILNNVVSQPMPNDISLIQAWIKGLIEKEVNLSIIHPEFHIEDGMSLEKYIDYEQKQFTDLSNIYDLTNNFSIKILDKYIISKNENDIKYGYFIYLINSINKIVCKMNLTIIEDKNFQYYLGSNNFQSQLVPKYSINNYRDNTTYKQIKNELTHIALALHSPLVIKDIISSDLERVFFNVGNNYQQDGFYYAQFNVTGENTLKIFNKFYFFYVILQDDLGKEIIEKRKIFFDIFDETLIPFDIKDNKINILNENYPVHISYWKKGKNYNKEYPRNFSLDINELDCNYEVIITDSIDNDWNIFFFNRKV